jgi:hypothetical protein
MYSTHRPGSYSIDAIGESSQWIVIKPSNGRWGSGRTIFASTCASTLHNNMRSNNSKCSGRKEVRVGGAHDSRFQSRTRVPCFAQRTFYVAELGAERDRMRSCFEGLTSVETEFLVECGKEEIFFWD